MSSSPTEILENFNRDRLTPRGRETFDTIALPLAEGHKYEEIEQETGLSKREQVKLMNDLRAEMKAVQDGPSLAPLGQEDYDTLKESIRQHGQAVPILKGKDGTVIDGNNRLKACEELGIDPDVKVLDVEGEDARTLGFVVNLTRRHLTASQRRSIVVQELLHDPEKSDRSIAIGLGVSPTTVGAARRQLQEQGQVSRMDTRRGQDGRTQRREERDLEKEPKDHSIENRLAAVAAQLKVEKGDYLVRVSAQLIEQSNLLHEWSPLVRFRAEVLESGLLDLVMEPAGDEDATRLSTGATLTELAVIRSES